MAAPETEVQILVEQLSSRLGRSVLVDDASLRLVAYSPVLGSEDEVRRQAILTRETPRAIRDLHFAQGIASASGPVRTPAKAELGLEPRVCVPIRTEGTLFGYLWLIDSDQSLSAGEVDVAVRAAAEIGAAMQRRIDAERPHCEREHELMEALLGGDPEARAAAAHELVAEEVLVPGTPVAACAVRPTRGARDELAGAERAGLGIVLEQLRRALPLRHAITLIRDDRAVVLLCVDGSLRGSGGVGAIARRLHEALERTAAAHGGWSMPLGVSDERAGLDEAWLAYAHACHAARVASRVPAHAPVAEWSELGVYRTLAHLDERADPVEVLHPAVRRLLELRGKEALVATLETYLDLGCDAKLTAEALLLHRASLYYRLQRIEEVAGVSLKRGDGRLVLHLGLKLAWLLGVHPAQRD